MSEFACEPNDNDTDKNCDKVNVTNMWNNKK